jgi:exoribonuclease-2
LQNEVSELTASFMKDNLVRADELPLVLLSRRPGFKLRNARVNAKLGTIDEMTLIARGSDATDS